MDKPTPTQIRDARIKAGLTQTAAGELVYVGVRTWQKWENGERKMHPGLWELAQLKLLNAHKVVRGA